MKTLQNIRKLIKPVRIALALLACVAATQTVHTAAAADPVFWTNPAGGDWADPANWGGTKPGPEDWATIANVPTSGNNEPYVYIEDDTNATVEKLDIDSSELQVYELGSLSVSDLTLTNTQTTTALVWIDGSLNATTITVGMTSGGNNLGEGNALLVYGPIGVVTADTINIGLQAGANNNYFTVGYDSLYPAAGGTLNAGIINIGAAGNSGNVLFFCDSANVGIGTINLALDNSLGFATATQQDYDFLLNWLGSNSIDLYADGTLVDASNIADHISISDIEGNTLYTAQTVPEPTTWAMLLGGLGVLALAQRRRARVVA